MILHPTLLAALGLFAQVQAGTPQPDASIYGRISASDSTAVGDPVASVVLEVTATGVPPKRLMSDATGTYLVPALDAGVYTIKFEREGYLPLMLDIRVPAHGSVHLDVTLDQLPPKMETIKVLARDVVPRIKSSRAAFSGYRPWRLGGDELTALPSLDLPDVSRAVATSPVAQAAPESGGGLHLQGGATDHTLLRVDGIPLYNAIHAGEQPSALDPDAVASISVFAEPQARDGGRLTGVVDVNSRASLPDSERFRSTIWPTGARALSLLPYNGGSALLSVRRNFARPVQGNTREPLRLGWSDLFATASVPLAGGDLTGMVFSSNDAVSFDAGGQAMATLPTANRFAWTSDARAFTWRKESGRRSVEARVWQSGTTVGADWLASPSQSFTLGNRFMQTAASSSVSWLGQRSQTTLGATFEWLSDNYATSGSTVANGSLSTAALLGFGGHSRVGAAFLEHSRALGDRLQVTAGERVVSVDGGGVLLEPRFAATLNASNGVRLSGSFARTHQYAQSMYNEESVVDALASLEMPVLAGINGVPIAASNAVSAEVAVPVGSSAVLNVGGFARDFRGLVLTSPSTGAPFSTQSFDTGTGTAFGGRVGVKEQLGRVSLEGNYSVSAVVRERSEQPYRPAFAPSHNLFVAAGYQVSRGTFLRASGWLFALRPTSPVLGAVTWEWQDAMTSQREVAGSPQYSAATLGEGRLPPYLRIDFGVRQQVNLRGPLHGKLSLFANLDNLLGRQNAAGVTQAVAGTRSRFLDMTPRSVSLGAALHF